VQGVAAFGEGHREVSLCGEEAGGVPPM